MKKSNHLPNWLLPFLLLPVVTFSYGQPSTNKPKLVIPFGHQLGIRESLFSHDNKLLVTSDETITIISDVRSGKPLFYCNGGVPAISEDDKYIASAVDSLVLIWNTANGELVTSLVAQTRVAHIQFHPSKPVLLIQSLAQGPDKQAKDFFDVRVWDFSSNQLLHTFNCVHPAEDKPTGKCNECVDGVCPIYGAWFTPAGDSIRLVCYNLIKTFVFGQYGNASRVCLTAPGAGFDAESTTTVLSDKVIRHGNGQTAWYFNEYGTFLCSGDIRPLKDATKGMAVEAECLSPLSKFLLTYNDQNIRLRDLTANTSRAFEVRGLKKMSFNRNGTLILAEFLNEAPRIFSTEKFDERFSESEAELKGFPLYVYETRTVPDAEAATAVFDSIVAKVPHLPKFVENNPGIFNIPDYHKNVSDVVSGVKNNINGSFTNSGYIVNLASNRPISKIQSLIKLSGDIKLSPDKNILFLNTGKVISLYSIPYARIISNLTGSFQQNVFSPDSKWLVQYNPGKKLNIVNLVTNDVKTVVPVSQKGLYYPVSFSADSKQVTVIAEKGACAIITLATGAIRPISEGLGYFSSEDGHLYGIVDSKARVARLYKKEDSTQLLTFDLTMKTKRRESGSYNYRISFSHGEHAVALWNERRVIVIRDLSHPADTVGYEGEGGLSRVTFSPNGAYLAIQTMAKSSTIFNCRTKSSFLLSPATGLDGIYKNGLGATLRSMSSGNLENITGAREIACFSPTGDSVMAYRGDSVYIYHCADSTIVAAYQLPGEVKYCSLLNDLVIAYYYGQLQFIRLSSRQPWFSMIPFTNGETVFLLPDGTYLGNKSTTRYLGYISDAKTLSYKQFDYNDNRPDLVLRALGNTDPRYLAIYDSSLSIRRQRQGLRKKIRINYDQAPEVTIANDKDIKGEVKEKDLALHLTIRGSKQYPDSLAVFINGNPLAGEKGIRLSHKSYSLDTTIHLTLTEGSNMIEVSVFDVNGLESYRQPLYLQYSPKPSIPKTVYFVGIGAQTYATAGHNLQYTKKDITEVMDSIRHYGYPVVADTLFDSRVTVENVRKLKSKLLATKPDDIVIVYYTGHGEPDKDNNVYFGTFDMDFNKPGKRGIAMKDLSYLTENIPARSKAIFIDACYSGETNQYGGQLSKEMAAKPIGITDPGETDPFDVVLQLYTDLYQGNGTDIIVASRGLEVAQECDLFEHGVFTYAVLNGISRLTADEDSNSVLTIGELQNYVTRNTPIFAKRCDTSLIQRANTRTENEYNDWPIAFIGNAQLDLRSPVKEVSEHPTIQTQLDSASKLRHIGIRQVATDPAAQQRLKKWFTEGVQTVNDLMAPKNLKFLKNYQRAGHPKTIPIFEDSSFSARYEIVDGNIVFTIVCPDRTPAVFVDVNGNGQADSCIDRVYTKELSADKIYTRCLMAPEPGMPWVAKKEKCKNAGSKAEVLKAQETYYFIMPVKEMSMTAGLSRVSFQFWADDLKSVIDYPQQDEGTVFGKSVEVKL